MSLIGKNPVFISSTVKLQIYKNFILIFGQFGELKVKCIVPHLIIKHKAQGLYFLPLFKNIKKKKKFKSLWGTFRMYLKKATNGVSSQYFLNLKLFGVGYKLIKKNKRFIFKLGFSHKIFFEFPVLETLLIKKTQKRPLNYKFSSVDYDLVKNIPFLIRSLKKPAVYKKKGFILNREILFLKEGKKIKN